MLPKLTVTINQNNQLQINVGLIIIIMIIQVFLNIVDQQNIQRYRIEQQMQLITNLSFIEAASQELISPKPCAYNILNLFQQVANYSQLKCEMIQVQSKPNNVDQKFSIYFISNKQQAAGQPCIVYLHGLASYSFEGMHLLPYIQSNFSLCLFDLRGHGKNNNPFVTYGLNQSQDLYYLIQHLICKKSISQIFLWGRSMGASTILNFINIYGKQQKIQQTIKYLILDSPFSSFQQIAKQTIANSLSLPYFVCSPLVNVALNRISHKTGINLRLLNFQHLSHVKFKTIFVYSEMDQIVNCSHSLKIIQGYGSKPQVLKGQFTHNQNRPTQMLNKIFRTLKNALISLRRQVSFPKAQTSRKGLSISLMSKNRINDKQQAKYSPVSRKQLLACQPGVQNKQNISDSQNCPKVHHSPTFSNLSSINLNIKVRKDNKQRTRQTKTKILISHRVIECQTEQRSVGKSKSKQKGGQFTLTNKRYI